MANGLRHRSERVQTVEFRHSAPPPTGHAFAPGRQTTTRKSGRTHAPRVLMLGKFFPPVLGGIEEYVHGLSEIVGERYDLTVLAHAKGRVTKREQHARYRLVRCGTWATVASQPLSPGMVRELLAARYDLIHLHAPNVLGVALVLALSRGAKIIVTHHADMVGFGAVGRLAAKLYRRLLRRTSAVTVLSLKNRDLAEDVRGVDVPFVSLPLAIDPNRFALTPDIARRAQTLRQRYGRDKTLFAFVGRLVPYKGLAVLIRALADVDNVRCLIVGDGPERDRLMADAAARGVGDKIIFMGSVSGAEKHAVLRAVDAFVLPSTTTAEAFGIVQVEAQLCGLPILTSDLPSGVTDVTRHGETGLTVPPGNWEALAAALRGLADAPDLRTRYGAAGLQRAHNNYVPDALRQQVFDLYESVLAG